MTIMDKVNAGANMVFNSVFDKEAINFMEAASLHTVIMQGRYNLAALECMYNQATDPELRTLVKEAVDITRETVNEAEDTMRSGGGHVPENHFIRRELHSRPVEGSQDAKLSDPEIVLTLVMMAKASQMALLTSLHQSYQPQVSVMYRRQMDAGLDHNYRVLQFMLKRGWLPYLDKVEH